VLAAAIAVLMITSALIDRRHVSAAEAGAFHFVNDLTSALYWPVWLVMQLGNLLAVPATAILALAGRRVRLSVGPGVVRSRSLVAGESRQADSRSRQTGSTIEPRRPPPCPRSGTCYVAGHAATAFSLAAVAFRYLGRRAKWVAISLALLVSIARVYVGVHFPLDVIGGPRWGSRFLKDPVHGAGAPDACEALRPKAPSLLACDCYPGRPNSLPI
jgi:glycosyltransferase 2 family protein